MVIRHALLGVAIASVAAAAGAQTPSTASGQSPARERPAASKPSGAAGESTGDFNAQGDVSANALIGAKVRNENRDTVGTVQDLYVDGSGSIKTVVIAVGGFLGVGSKDVAVKWSDLKRTRDGKSVVLSTGLSKDQLNAMPSFKDERRVPSQAATPK